MEVSSRLWPATVLGRRSYKNTNNIINNTIRTGKINGRILITTDGFEPYEHRIKALIGVACVYAQVIKTIRKNRVSSVDRRYVIGSQEKFEEELSFSEDSNTVNTSFIERQNLTIRHGSAYLSRKTLCHARQEYLLEANLNLLRCYYNFIRPHLSLKFGELIKTPAMQAGLTERALTFREIFSQKEFIILIIVIYNTWLRKHQISGEIAVSGWALTLSFRSLFQCYWCC